MKAVQYKWLLMCSLSLLLGACSSNNDNDGQNDPAALFESNFVNDRTLKANPARHTVVTALESASSEDNLTGEAGIDRIPYSHGKSGTYRFCFDEHEESAHRFTIEDTDGVGILHLTSGDDCADVYMPLGDYAYVLTHDGQSERTFPVFIRPQVHVEAQAKNDSILLLFARDLLAMVGEGLISKANASEPVLTTLFSTGSCVQCDFTASQFIDAPPFDNVDLSGADFSFSNFTGATITNSQFSNANFYHTSTSIYADTVCRYDDDVGSDCGPILTGSDFSHANFTHAYLLFSDFSKSIFKDNVFKDADMQGANFTSASIASADFTDADLTNTTFKDAVINDSNFCNATTDGSDLSLESNTDGSDAGSGGGGGFGGDASGEC